MPAWSRPGPPSPAAPVFSPTPWTKRCTAEAECRRTCSRLPGAPFIEGIATSIVEKTHLYFIGPRLPFGRGWTGPSVGRPTPVSAMKRGRFRNKGGLRGMEPAARKIRLLAVALCFVFILSLPAFAERQLGERILSAGSWGADVFELQRELIRAGYEVQATGLFGTQTEAAVIALQLAHGLEPDGRVGPATLAALRSRRRTMEY